MKSSSTSATKVIRVLIADDHPIVREGFVTILKSEKDIEVVAEAADGKETCVLYNELAPDVLLLDLRMPEKDGLQVITELMSHGEPKPRIIVMTTNESEGELTSSLEQVEEADLAVWSIEDVHLLDPKPRQPAAFGGQRVARPRGGPFSFTSN
jgi:CheY-like chemotaxis protein